jgi:radical SAM protein with 4Fe4S-binding SPASM domain
MELLDRVVVPTRLSLIYRSGDTMGYNPGLNTWERLPDDTAELIRWLRAGRERKLLVAHMMRRFGYEAGHAGARIQEITQWCILRRLLYLDSEPVIPALIFPDNPLSAMYWICTQACNLRCSYCYQDANVARQNELSTAEAKHLVDQATEVGASRFVFTGGEPFVRRDLLEVARHSRERGLRTNVITNGHYITKKTIAEVASTFHHITVSLDHMIPEHHDEIRGKGSWRHAVNAIELILEAGISLDVNSVLSRLGLKDVAELLRLGEKFRVGRHRIVPQYPMGRGGNNRGTELSSDEVLNLGDTLNTAKQALAEGRHLPTSLEGNYSTKRKRTNHCGAGLSEISVDPEGWVYPCRLLQYPHLKSDNIRTRSLRQIYAESLPLRESRARRADLLQPCRTCIIREHCGGGCRGIHASFTQDPGRAHPLFCAYIRGTFEVEAWASTGKVPPPRTVQFQNPPSSLGEIIPVSAVVRKSTPKQ